MSQPFRVAVIGGGTGGLCLAHGLRKAGISVDVYERSLARTERLQGYRVHINPYGSRALSECLPAPLWEAFVATCGVSAGSFGFVTERLDELLVLGDQAKAPAGDPASSHHSVSRITLHQVLSAGLEDVLHLGKEFERYERAEDGTITCHFADGSTATADVLVAADGANSRVRAQYLPHAERVDTGVLAVAGKFPLTDETAGVLPARLTAGPNTVIPPKGLGMFIAPHVLGERSTEIPREIGGNDEIYEHNRALFDNTSSYLMWAFAASEHRYPPGTKLSELDGVALRAVVGEMISDWHPGLRRMVCESPPEAVSMLPIRTSVPVEQWPATNVTLLGDAIHSMTPMRGIGANVALRDAKLLCDKLTAAARGELGLLEAIADYERQMTGYGFAAVRESLRSAEQFISENGTARIMFKTVLRLASKVPAVKRKMFGTHGE